MRPLLRTFGSLTLAASLATPALADVTVTQKVTGGMAAMSGAESTTYIKGSKMRTDGQAMGQATSTIIDLDAQRMVVLHTAKQEAEIHDLTKMSANLQKNIATAKVKADLTPSGQTRQVLGHTCKGYNLSVVIPMAMTDVPISMGMKGTVWVAEGAPGAADYAAFYAAATDKGMFFGGGQQGGQSPRGGMSPDQGMAAIYKALAGANGIPYLMDVTIQIEASGPMAEMMKKMGPQGWTTEVTRVSTESLADDLFSIPAGYTTRNK